MCYYAKFIDVLKIINTKEIYFSRSPVVNWEQDIIW